VVKVKTDEYAGMGIYLFWLSGFLPVLGKILFSQISLSLPAIIRLTEKALMRLNMQVVKWCVDLIMGIVFLISFVTGFFKFTLLVRTFGLTDIVLPLALMSNIHDWAGLSLCILVAVHLFLNRGWILSMTRKIMNGTIDSP
jgi:hypothetical protein